MSYDFWNRPQWAAKDNLRDPGTEPFWMREEARPPALPRFPLRSRFDHPAFWNSKRVHYWEDREILEAFWDHEKDMVLLDLAGGYRVAVPERELHGLML